MGSWEGPWQEAGGCASIYHCKNLVSLFPNRMKEENKKLLSEKEKLENKLKATLGSVDHLQVGHSWMLFVCLSLEWRPWAVE